MWLNVPHVVAQIQSLRDGILAHGCHILVLPFFQMKYGMLYYELVAMDNLGIYSCRMIWFCNNEQTTMMV